jgi:hypothetical protein
MSAEQINGVGKRALQQMRVCGKVRTQNEDEFIGKGYYGFFE